MFDVQTSDADHCGCNCTNIFTIHETHNTQTSMHVRKSGLELKSGLVLFVVVVITITRNLRNIIYEMIGVIIELRGNL